MTHTQTPLKCFPSKCDLTLSGHTVIAREGEAPYAYTCAGVGSEICEYVNAHEALTRQNAALRKALEAVRDDEGLADVIAGVGEGIPPFMHKVLDALAMEKL